MKVLTTKNLIFCLGITSLLFLPAAVEVHSAPAPLIKNATAFHYENSTRLILGGDISLPGPGHWELLSLPSNAGIANAYLTLTAGGQEKRKKARASKQTEQKLRMGLDAIRHLSTPIRYHALTHGHVGPESFADLVQDDSKRITRIIARPPWGALSRKQGDAPYLFLMPNVPFAFSGESNVVNTKDRLPLILELIPFVDDGKHWVLFTDGTCERVDIDQTLIQQHGLTIQAASDEVVVPKEEESSILNYRLIVVRDKQITDPMPFVFHNKFSGKKLKISWEPNQLTENDPTVLVDLQKARSRVFYPYYLVEHSNVLSTWLDWQKKERRRPSGNRPGSVRQSDRELTVFGLLGGQAAMAETLQLQAIADTDEETEARTVLIENLAGVEIQSHPYDLMLGEDPGGRLPLADFTPLDRFFLYVDKPGSINAFLEKGAEFISRFGGALAGSNFDYNLKEKYLTRLGMNAKWLNTFFQSGVVKESAFLLSDLFLLDGSDLTVITRLSHPKLTGQLLKLVGVVGLDSKKIIRKELGGDNNAYWVLRDDLLIASTSKTELDKVLDLYAAGGKGSLGQSAEFRYMLARLPVTEKTRLYAYLSDKFVRRLISPEIKIAQLRRLSARAEMERLTATALLAYADGLQTLDLNALSNNGYLPQGVPQSEYEIGPDLTVSSTTHGTLAWMKSLSENLPDMVTPREANLYKEYVNNYNRYWRRYFDPIALRVNDEKDGFLEATTYILPLIDNSAYTALRDTLVMAQAPNTLKIPAFSPDPMVMFSFNLQEKIWQSVIKPWFKKNWHYTGIATSILDDLGPGLHLAIQDADPVIALGSGDILGAFNADIASSRLSLLLPMALSILTRPCTIAIESQNPDRTRLNLRASTRATPIRQEGGVTTDFYQVGDKDEWVWVLEIAGMVRLRYGLELSGNYLLVRNIPWREKARIAGVNQAPFNGAMLQVSPERAVLQLRGLFAAAVEREQAAATQGMALLFPLVFSGFAGPDDAQEKHALLFGYTPVHPGAGNWQWDGLNLASSRYGSVRSKRQPPYEEAEDNFGLLHDIENLRLNMQFEDSGLRAAIRWKTR